MAFGDRILRRGTQGDDVVELQICLAGFRGTIWDGDFGPGTELQVVTFQRDYMGMTEPDGIVGSGTFNAIDRFANEYTIDFDKLKCPCGKCDGFGKGRYKDEYREGFPEVERYYKSEYPCIHRAILHSFRSAQLYAKLEGFPAPFISSGYRCWTNNLNRGRTSTNHMGKAIDFDFPLQDGEDKRDDSNRCDRFRGILTEKCNFQIGWGANNRKALEPSTIAPTWIHADMRCYNRKFLDDSYFVKSLDELDSKNLLV